MDVSTAYGKAEIAEHARVANDRYQHLICIRYWDCCWGGMEDLRVEKERASRSEWVSTDTSSLSTNILILSRHRSGWKQRDSSYITGASKTPLQ